MGYNAFLNAAMYAVAVLTCATEMPKPPLECVRLALKQVVIGAIDLMEQPRRTVPGFSALSAESLLVDELQYTASCYNTYTGRSACCDPARVVTLAAI